MSLTNVTPTNVTPTNVTPKIIKLSQIAFRGGSIFLVWLYLVVFSCGPVKPDLIALSKSNPAYFIARQDSLLKIEQNNPQLIPALATAHLSLAQAAVSAANWVTAIHEFEAVLKLESDNKSGRYGKSMAEGFQLYKKGDRSSLWDAIVKFGNATIYDQRNGEPYYWMAKAYEKKDDDDFDLIIEAYDKALALNLSDEIKYEAESARSDVIKREQIFEEFWK